MASHSHNKTVPLEYMPEALLSTRDPVSYPPPATIGMARYSPPLPPHLEGASASACLMSSEPTIYPSLFQPKAEVPPFYAAYRWWEDEAATVFWSFDAQKVKRVIGYGLFRDPNFPRSALRNRPAETIDAFLIELIEPHESSLVSTLSHFQKVEEILRKSRINNLPLVAWSWFPSGQDDGLDASAIAKAIDAESHLQFTRISFEEVVRYTLGYKAPSVDWFFQQHSTFYIHLMDHLRAFPEQVPRYIEVETHLRSRSPFAHRALVHCLREVHPEASVDIPMNTRPAFTFIAAPLQRLFRDLPPSLTEILQVLNVLGVRFQQNYVHSRDMDWNKHFNVAFSFLEDMMGSTSAEDFARNLFNSDEKSFSTLTQESIAAEDETVKRLSSQWQALSTEVCECCTALPDCIPYVQDCARSLLVLQDFHSLTAILDGLKKYSITQSIASIANGINVVAPSPVLPSRLVILMNPAQNFLAYRETYETAPGIPYLLPHIREYRQTAQPVLWQFFQKVQPHLR